MRQSEYWKEKWNKSAKENDDVRFISGWGDISFQEMLFVINDIVEKLEISFEDIFLDAGCGAGLFEIAFAYKVKEIYAIDFSKNMVKHAQKNNRYDNIVIERGNIKELHFQDEFFHKVLANSTIQYLNNTDEVSHALNELIRVTKEGGRILVSLIPDSSTKDDFIDGYYYLGLSEDEIKSKIECANMVLWFDVDELVDIIDQIGICSVKRMKPVNAFQQKYYFDLLIKK